MPARTTIYNRVDGPVEMYAVDAAHALKFPADWKKEPWTGADEMPAAAPAGAPEPDPDAKAPTKSKTS